MKPDRWPGLPVELRLDGRRVAVLGPGAPERVAERAAAVAACGAVVVPAAPAATDELAGIDRAEAAAPAATDELAGIDRAEAAVPAGVALVLWCGPVTDGQAAALRARCRAGGALLWVEDRPEQSDVTFPALLVAGPVRVAVSTGGRSSALARAVRDALRPLLGAGFAAWAEAAVARRARRPRGRFTGGFEAGADDER